MENLKKLAIDIWRSFLVLPLWVRLWMVVVLIPVNLYSIFFLNESFGLWIASLAYLGMLFNVPVVVYERGFSKFMSIAHIVPWTVLLVLIVAERPEGTAAYINYLLVLFVTNFISLVFDYIDAVRWFKGDRNIAG